MSHHTGVDADADQPGTRNDLSGTVIGPSVQAGVIHGNVYFHGSNDARPVPHQLPAPSPLFVNRRDELARLDDVLDSGRTNLAVLTGPGGVGKTALATRWAHGVRDGFAGGQVYIDLGGFSDSPPVHPGEALSTLLRAFGVAPQQVPLALHEQVALYRSITANLPLLVLLDNAYSAAQARVLLPASTSSMVVVTSRRRLVGLIPDGARLIEVGPLPVEDSITLLSDAVGAARIGRESDEAHRLAAMCGGLPIALWIAAARLASRPHLSVRRLATELADETRRLRGLSDHHGPSPQTAFDLSYQYLDPDSSRLYRRLALHPGPEFGPGPVAALAPRDDANQSDANPLEALLEANLLREVAEDRFRFHDLLRLHATRKAQMDDSQDDRDAAVRAMLEWYLAAASRADLTVTPYRRRLPFTSVTEPHDLPTFADRDEALGWLEQERVNLILAGRAALDHGWAELSWHLCDVMWPLFLYGKHHRDRIEVDQLGLAAARVWKNGWAEADMLKRLSRICSTIGDYPAAERHARAAMIGYREVGDRRGETDARESLASLCRDSGRDREAAEIFTQVLAANRELGDDRSIGLTLVNLGLLLPRLGRPDEAIALLREAKGLFANLSRIDPYNEARVGTALAGAYLGTGDLASAEVAASETAQRMHDLGSEYERAEALAVLGRIAVRRGDTDDAERRLRSALEIFDKLEPIRAADVRREFSQLRSGDPTRE
jgi:tetratricopeptide (TPR) repeat protein